MYTYILILESPDMFQAALRALEELGPATPNGTDRYMVNALVDRKLFGWIAIFAGKIEDDYDLEDLLVVKSIIPNPFFVAVEGHDEQRKFSDEFVMALGDIPNALIDNDHGIVAPLQTIQELISKQFNWKFATRLP